MTSKSDVEFQPPDFYLRRYIISKCMTYSDVQFIKDGSKASNWKKPESTQIRISPENVKNIELKLGLHYQGLEGVSRETAQDDAKTPYLVLTFSKDSIAISDRPEFLDTFEAACLYILEKDLDRIPSLLGDKVEQFKNMIEKTKSFLTIPAGQPTTVPPVPKAPPAINFDTTAFT